MEVLSVVAKVVLFRLKAASPTITAYSFSPLSSVFPALSLLPTFVSNLGCVTFFL